MKIDMHCHVREGSIDSKVPIEEFIKKLQSKGIGGMLVTDHDTYNGYRHWKNTVKGRKYKDFVVLKGIEYDTLDAGAHSDHYATGSKDAPSGAERASAFAAD